MAEILGKEQTDLCHVASLCKIIGKFSWADVLGLGARTR